MKNPLSLFAVAFFLTIPFLGSCAVPVPTAEELSSADYGEMPNAESAKTLLEIFIKVQLKDPDSAKYAWGSLEKVWCQPFQAKENLFCWALPVSVNAKNSYGAYAGSRLWTGYFRGEDMVAIGSPQSGRSGNYTAIISLE